MQVYGIDLSKEKFDVSFIDAKGKEKKQKVKNAVAPISRFLSSVSKDGILCAEHTGVYGDLYVVILQSGHLFGYLTYPSFHKYQQITML